MVICDLVVKPAEWSDSDLEQYLADVRNAIDEVSTDSVYRCSSGRRFQMKVAGIMKSGWVGTILANSMSQIFVHLLALVRMGYSDEQILSPAFNMMAGGDDTLQTIPDDFDVDRYLREHAILGIKITEHQVHNCMEGAEYFSTKLNLVKGVITFRPCRFTKHIYSLLNTNLTYLGQALVSHMNNYCWDYDKFAVFKKIYEKFRADHPELVDHSLFREGQYWRYKSKGYEGIF